MPKAVNLLLPWRNIISSQKVRVTGYVMPYDSNGACNYCLNSSIHLSLLKGGMYLRDNPGALIISNMPKSILAINVVRKGCVFSLQGKVVYSYGWVGEEVWGGGGSILESMSHSSWFELVKFPQPRVCFSSQQITIPAILRAKCALCLRSCIKCKSQGWNNRIIAAHYEEREAICKRERERSVCVVTHSFVNVTSCNPNHAARPIHFFH